ncbi:MAG TPA: 2'-5' RNA ligase family protein [Stellaceae bacterium]|nr:2'-5' RNA ligase family protein [Stellaceae bacterium]
MFASGELRGRRVERDRLHISLNFVGEYFALPEAPLAAVREAVSTLKVPSFVVSLNAVTSFENNGRKPRVFVGDDGVCGVLMLHRTIHEALTKAGLQQGTERRITPHLTLSREDDKLPDDGVDPVSWRVREFRLIHSRQGQSRHNVLGSWPILSMPNRVDASAN